MESLFSRHVEEEAPAGGRYARVCVERGLDRAGAGGDGLTYACGEDVEVGDRVMVPLGRGDVEEGGVVVEVGGAELLGGIPAGRVKRVKGKSGPRLARGLVELAKWMAGYYVCPLGMVLATMVPAAVKQGTGVKIREVVERAGGEAERAALEAAKMTPGMKRAWAEVAELEPGAWPLDAKDLAGRIGAANTGVVKKLVKAGLLRLAERREVRSSRGVWAGEDVESGSGERPELTARQKEVVEGICGGLGGFGVHLVRGVTGSGKTEVYLRVIERVLAEGKRAVVLVPEISLTPQTAGRFLRRFGGEGVAVLHSGLSAAQRHRQWAMCASGSARVVVGARSAVFAPMEGLGVIVVDEEHAGDYKQDQLPRYHGRDVAIKRAQLEGCAVILGSATPSMESWANAAGLGGVAGGGGGKYALWEMKDRVGGGRLPRVEVVDVTEERRAAGKAWGKWAWRIGPTLARGMEWALGGGGQAIVLINRRGFANYICCGSRACGWVMGCGECDATMVYHRTGSGVGAERPGYVRCHHCLAEQRLAERCPECGGRVSVLGSGTQSVEEELSERFDLVAGVTMERVDGDTMRGAKDYFAVLSRFASGEVRVLVGTQMIAKGLDYPNVRLVGVVDADTSLSLPDFRAAERTFQLVSQVSGRAGRGEHAGRVVVQTVNAGNPAIERAAAHDYEGFAREELEHRRRAGLPPARRMARIVVRDREEEKAMSQARLICAELKRAVERGEGGGAGGEGGGGVTIMGPGPAPVSRVAGYFRVEIVLLASARGVLQGVLRAVRERGMLKSDARTAVDIDPVSVM